MNMQRLETEILYKIDFDLLFPSSRKFLEVYASMVGATRQHIVYGEFILEIALLEERISNIYRPSMIAMAALYLSCFRIN